MGQWTTEGIQWALECLFSEEQAVPANLYMGMCEDLALTKADTLASLTEVAGAGYARGSIPTTAVGWISAIYNTDDRKMTSDTVTFNASGDWTVGRCWFIATTIDGSGKLLCWDSIGEAILLSAGESHDQVATVYGVG
jgi:hypothetical protein